MIEKFKLPSNPVLGTRCIIGLDRDGVINHNVDPYVMRVDQFDPIPGSIKAVADLRRKGFQIVIITNQRGIGRGMMSVQDVEEIHSHMLNLFGQAGCPSIDGIYYASGPDKKDPFVKPNVGMFKRAEEHNKNIKFNQGFFVGDSISDLKAALKMGARPVLVRTGHGLETEKELNKYTYKELKEKTYIFDSLADFAANIE